MKNFLSKFSFGLVALLLFFAVTAYTPANAKVSHVKHKTEKVLVKQVSPVNSVFNIVDVRAYSPGDLPPLFHKINIEPRVYAIVANALKPDNTLYQLIRAKQLKIHNCTERDV